MKKETKILLYLSLSFNFIAVIFIIIMKIAGVQYLINVKKNIASYVTDKKSILFLGDSITAQVTWDDICNNAIAINYANGGNTTELITNTLNMDFVDRADKIIVMAGVNDLGAGKTPEQTINSYSTLLKKLGNNPNKIIIQSILPINESMTGFNHPAYKTTSKNIVKLNSLIKTLCFNQHIQYIDIYHNMESTKDQLNPDYTFDGVHLNSNGYKVWKAILRSQVHVR